MGRASPTVLVVGLSHHGAALEGGLDDCAIVHVDTAAEALEVVGAREIDVLVTAQELPGEGTGLSLLRGVSQVAPVPRTVLAAEHLDVETAVAIANEGVFRLLHTAAESALVKAVEETVAAAPRRRGAEALEALSAREREVVELVADGLRVAQVAERLFVSPHTVRNHLKRAFPKLGVHSQAELIQRFGRSPVGRPRD